jgi:hypothetical protein
MKLVALISLIINTVRFITHSSCIPNRITECGSQTVVSLLLLESVLPEFDHYLAIYTFSTLQHQFHLKKLNKVEAKKYSVEVSNRVAALEDLDAEVDINSAWETIGKNIKISAKESLGYYELKKHTPWFDEGCS